MIYVLIVVALFAAVNFILSKQNDGSEMGTLSSDKVEIYASDIQQTAYQVKQAIDQMVFTGVQPDQLDFTLPSDEPDFSDASTVPYHRKVYHPLGGGLSVPSIPSEAISEVDNDPAPAWYLLRAYNVEWTPTSQDDVMLVAHQINEGVCALINKKITGSTDISTMDIEGYLLSSDDFTVDDSGCTECEGSSSLCVTDGSGMYSYYNIIAAQ